MANNRQNVRLVYEDFRAIRKGEPGYRSTTRRYISETTGEVITRYSMQKHARRVDINTGEVFARKSVEHAPIEEVSKRYGKPHPISQIAKRANYEDKLHLYINQINKSNKAAGIPGTITYKQARESDEFKQLYADLRSKDNSPKGRKARALVAFGLRDESADYDVGETP